MSCEFIKKRLYVISFLIVFSSPLILGDLVTLSSSSPNLNKALKTFNTPISEEILAQSPQFFLKRLAYSALLAGKGMGANESATFKTFSTSFKFNTFLISPVWVLGLNLQIFPFLSHIKDIEDFRIYFYLGALLSEKIYLGGGFSYQVKDSQYIDSVGLLEWGGIKIRSGIEVLKLKYRSTKRIDQIFLKNFYKINFKGTSHIGVDLSSLSLPLEVSTSFKILYMMTFYGGIGFDLNLISSKGKSSLKNLEITLEQDGEKLLDEDIFVETGFGKEVLVDTFTSRAFVGLNFHIALFKIFCHLERTLNTSFYGSHIGFTMEW